MVLQASILETGKGGIKVAIAGIGKGFTGRYHWDGLRCYISLLMRWVKVLQVAISDTGKGVKGRYY